MVHTGRFSALDALRGSAAIAVVLNHWKHFFYNGVSSESALDRSASPLYNALMPFYEFGWIAVDLFFCLSGFVFFLLYFHTIRDSKVSAARFFWLRFSRLYPLHFATLMLVLGLQLMSMAELGGYTVYPENDLYHFFLNIFFIPSWGAESGLSFNAPVWSVSVEVFLYVLFYLYAKFIGRESVAVLIGCSALGLLSYSLNTHLSRGIGSFFVGGAVCFIFLRSADLSGWQRRVIFGSTIVLWGLTFYLIYLPDNYITRFLSHTPVLPKILLMAIVFPMTIYSLALAEKSIGVATSRLSFLGDWSYGVYLLHFPLQLGMILLVNKMDLPESLFLEGWFMAVFFMLLLLGSWCSYRYFECPMQNILRKKYK